MTDTVKYTSYKIQIMYKIESLNSYLPDPAGSTRLLEYSLQLEKGN